MEESPGLGNQQESAGDDLSWLAGFYDGEGSFSIGLARQRGYASLQPQITLSNTHHPSIEEVARILADHGVPCHIQRRDGTKRARPLFVATITGLKRCQRALRLLGPYLRTKAEPATLMRRFVDSRLGRGKHAPYSDAEIETAIACREANATRNARSSETVRRAFVEARRKIQSAPA